MSEKKLLSWFEKEREDIIVQLTKQHIARVVLCAEEFERAFDSFLNNDKATMKGAIERVVTYEREADAKENTIYEELSKGELEPKDRYDLMRMVRQADHIADWLKGSSMDLKLIADQNLQFDEITTDKINTLIDTTLKAVTTLRNATLKLGTDDPGCRKLLKEVNALEKAADKEYFEAKTQIFSKGTKANDLISSIEQASDYCKSTAEMMELLIVSGR